MTLDHLRIAIRNLLREPVYGAIAVAGLSIGLAACLLLLGFVQYAWRYDAHVPGVDQLYVVKQRFNVDAKAPWFDQAPMLLREAALSTPGVTDATAFFRVDPPTVRVGSQLQKMPSLLVLPRFANVLGLAAIEGDLTSALGRPDGVALTESTARRLFGATAALGQALHIGDKTIRVSAILRDPPPNTTIPFEALYGVNSVLVSQDMRTELQTGAHGSWGRVLLRIAAPGAVEAIGQALQAALDRAPGVQGVPPDVRARLGERKVMDLALSPLRHAYFDREVARNPISSPGDRGDPATVAALAVIALMILAIGAINYMNLATLRVLRRQREIGMRKVLGASVRQIVLQFMAESVAVSMLATLLGLLMARLALPLFADLVNRKLDGIVSASNIGIALLLGLLLGVVAGIQPALAALRVRPAQALAGRGDAEPLRGVRMRKVLAMLQVGAAIGLASVAMGIAVQTSFALNAAPGFDPAPLLIVDLPERGKKNEAVRGFLGELGAHPGVQAIALSEHVVGRFGNDVIHEFQREGGTSVSIDAKMVDTNFFDVYRLKPLAGRLFEVGLDKENDAVPVVINAIAARQLGFASPQAAVGQPLQRAGEDGKLLHHRIVGIAPELQYRSLHDEPRATIYELNIDWAGTLSVRATGTVADVEQAVAGMWRRYFPSAIMQTQRAADILAANYADDVRLAKLLALATAIALAIMTFGMYALSASIVQRRSREIVLRKLYGAGRSQIAALLGRELGGLMVGAAVFGLPLAFLAIGRYQASFVEQAPTVWLAPWLALGCVAAVTLAASIRHAWRALAMRPGQLLR